MRKLLTLLFFASTATMMAQCTVVDIPLDSLSIRWTHGYADAQGDIWGVAAVQDGSRDLIAMHLDPSGDPIWTKRYSKLNPWHGLYPMLVVPSASGGMLILGNHKAPNHENFFGLELDANGDIVWGRLYMEPVGSWDGTDFNPSVVALPGGDYQLILAVGDGVHAVRLGSDGSILWHKRYHLDTGSWYYDIGPALLTADGGLVHTAALYPSIDTTGAALVFRTDMQGAIEWVHVYDKPLRPRSIIETSNGDLLIGGRICDNVDGCTTSLTRYSSNGALLWSKQYGGSEQISSIEELSNGDLLFGVEFKHGWYVTSDSLDLVRTSASGDIITAYDWNFDEPIVYIGGENYLSTLTDHGTTLMARNDGSIIATGSMRQPNSPRFVPRMIIMDQTTDPTCEMTALPASAVQTDVLELSETLAIDSDTVRTWTMAMFDPIG